VSKLRREERRTYSKSLRCGSFPSREQCRQLDGPLDEGAVRSSLHTYAKPPPHKHYYVVSISGSHNDLRSAHTRRHFSGVHQYT
jgi:hypothetical protein